MDPFKRTTTARRTSKGLKASQPMSATALPLVADSRTTTYSPKTLERSGAYACSPRRRFLLLDPPKITILCSLPSIWFPRYGEPSSSKCPTNQRTEKSTFVYEYAINTVPRPCENALPHSMGKKNEKIISAGFQKANAGYIEAEDRHRRKGSPRL
ncbi:uncharacterized protein F4812DRAFT_370398 [Daldinia caldariorum]|uniref:uncharacterized protein n=1 Tax=Daldinia caldariorum TaxID=326644 RepID=UPI0020084C81|nr:uncharacterized protein F4812DRAFT_370398 [Daldinia caldariorum]KAI1468481.1 hypothetical protein F4812DRAFT_370398 [Daldinia caldariorum]